MKTAVGSEKESAFALIFADFKEITKARLAISVVFSSIAGYFLGAYEIQWVQVLLLAFGGYCMVGASNAYNQVIEKDLDVLMKRTKNRPIPAGRMTVNTAMSLAIVLTLLGIFSLYLLNPK
ncbi:MAG: UbiA family prenyltransferase, partial [Maribacter sp.]